MRCISSLIIILGLLFGLSAMGQTQQGYVKTLGRPDKKGEPLSGVSVRVKGEHNPVLSKDNGKFEMILTGKKNGDAYTLQEVQKKGYELNETGVIGYQYAYSDKVALTIVMVSSAQLQADKQRIENNAYKVAEKNYKAKLELLEKQKNDKALPEDNYRKELLDLQDKFEKYQLLIDGLAEHYAHVDYDELSDREREVNICIENGELERADSLIKTLFDPIDVLKRNKKALSQLNLQISEANTIIDKANEDMAAVLKQQEKDAAYLYHLYTIALSRYDKEQANFYIRTRAELDTLNLEWQYDAAEFMREYLSDIDETLIYTGRIFNCPVPDEDYVEPWWGPAFNVLGTIMVSYEEYEDAIDSFKKSAGIAIILKGEDNAGPDLSTAYCNIGLAYNMMGEYEQALTHFKLAANVSTQCLGEKHPDVALCYNNIGGVYNAIGDYKAAILYFLHALEIYQSCESDVNIAVCYNNIGMAYAGMEDIKNASDNYLKALNLWKKIFGERHPYTATVYNNLGELCRAIGQFENAYKYHVAALAIYQNLYGEEHSNVAACYNNIGVTMLAADAYERADFYFTKSAEIVLTYNPDNKPLLVKLYINKGEVNRLMNNFNSAIEFYEQALEIAKELYTDNSIDVGTIYNNMGAAYMEQHKNVDAIHYFTKAYNVFIHLLPEDHSYLLGIKERLHKLNK